MKQNISTNGWSLPVFELSVFDEKLPYHIFTSNDHDAAVLIYNIRDVRMATYVGSTAVFINKHKPKLNRGIDFSCLFYDSKSVKWFKKRPILAVKVLFFDLGLKRVVVPIILVNFKNKVFASIRSKKGLILELEEENNDILIKENSSINEQSNGLQVLNERSISLGSLNWEKFPINTETIGAFLKESSYLI